MPSSIARTAPDAIAYPFRFSRDAALSAMASGDMPNSSKRKLAEPVGAKMPGTPSIFIGTGCDSTTTSATALPRPPKTVCSSQVTMAPVSSAACQNRIGVDRPHRRHVEDPGGNATGLQDLGGLQCSVSEYAVGDDGHVTAIVQHVGLADLEDVAFGQNVRNADAAQSQETGAVIALRPTRTAAAVSIGSRAR